MNMGARMLRLRRPRLTTSSPDVCAARRLQRSQRVARRCAAASHRAGAETSMTRRAIGFNRVTAMAFKYGHAIHIPMSDESAGFGRGALTRVSSAGAAAALHADRAAQSTWPANQYSAARRARSGWTRGGAVTRSVRWVAITRPRSVGGKASRRALPSRRSTRGSSVKAFVYETCPPGVDLAVGRAARGPAAALLALRLPRAPAPRHIGWGSSIFAGDDGHRHALVRS